MALQSQMKPAVAQQLRRPSVAVCATSPAARTPEASKRAATKATRAPSAYNLYVKEHYQSVSARLKAKGLPADLTNVGKHLRQQWSALSDREKAPYAAKSQKLKEEIAGTGSRSTSPVAARGVARASSASVRPVSPSARGQRPATPQPTSKPLPPYEAFITEQFPAVKASHATASATEITKLLEEMWARVPQAQKDAKALRYKAELAAYMSGSGPSGSSSSARSSPQAARSYSPAPSSAPRAPTPTQRPSQRPNTPRGAPTAKPLPPFEAFTQEQFTIIKASNPKSTTQEISRIIDDLWARVPQGSKDAKQRRYEAELQAYNTGNSGASSSSRGYSPAPARPSSSPTARSYSPAASSRPATPRAGTPRGSSAATEPLPPWEAFSKEQAQVIKATYPKASQSEVDRMISEMWAKLPSSLKDAKEARYRADLAAYQSQTGNTAGSRGSSSYSSAPARSYTPSSSSRPTSPSSSSRPATPRAGTPRGSSVASEPLPPWEAFSKEQAQVIKATYPKASQSEVDRMIQDLWGKLPSSLKEAKEKRYHADLAAYKAQGGSSSGSRSYSPAPARNYSPSSSSRPTTPSSSSRPATPRAGTPRGSSAASEPLPPREAFSKEQAQVIKATYPKASQSEVDRMISEMWAKLPTSLKDAKEARYRADLAAYQSQGGSSAGSRAYSPAPARDYSPSSSSRPTTPSSSSRPATPRAGTPRGSSVASEPLPPWEAFSKEQAQVIKATYPKASQSEVDRMIQDLWGKLPSSLKDAKEARYRADLAAYKAQGGSSSGSRATSAPRSYSPAPARSYSPTPAARAPTPSVRPSASRGAPTSEPLPPFDAFSTEQRMVIKSGNPKASDSEINRMINDLWSRVPQAQKDAKQKRYESELAAYNQSQGGSRYSSSAGPRRQTVTVRR